jgi:hypothetical protein
MTLGHTFTIATFCVGQFPKKGKANIKALYIMEMLAEAQGVSNLAQLVVFNVAWYLASSMPVGALFESSWVRHTSLC